MLGTVALLAAGTLSAACGGNVPAEDVAGPPRASLTGERTHNGVYQRVTITPATPARGDTVTLRSVLVNRGVAPLTVSHVVCGLDFADGRVFENPFVHCAAYSATRSLAPGDSVVQLDRRIVAAGPGSYTVRVRHLLEPGDLSVDLPFTVVRR